MSYHFIFIGWVTILDASGTEFNETTSSFQKEDAYGFTLSRWRHWENMGYVVKDSGVRKIRKNGERP